MPTCTNGNCSLIKFPGHEMCILHAEIADKEVAEFDVELGKHIEQQLAQHDGHVALEGIYFPKESDGLDYVLSKFSGISLKTLSINYCTLPDSMNIKNLALDKFEMTSNKGKSLSLRKSKLSFLKIVDNELSRLEISETDIEQLVFITYCPAGLEPPKMGTVFLILNEIKNFQISNQLFTSLHIAVTTIHGTFTTNNLKLDDILIRDSAFLSIARFEDIQPSNYFIFARCIIDKPRLFTIIRSDLSRSGFKGTNVAEINFIDNKWREKEQGHIKILDHCFADNSESHKLVAGPYGKVSLNQCLETYRQLKINFEKKGNYIDAGDFHFCEMELCRLLNSRLSIYSIYKFLSGYGESPIRSILVFVFALFALSCLHLFSGFEIGNSVIDFDIKLSEQTNLSIVKDYLNSVRLTFANLTLRNIELIKLLPNSLNLFLWIFETIFGPMQIALIVLAIKRKIRR